MKRVADESDNILPSSSSLWSLEIIMHFLLLLYESLERNKSLGINYCVLMWDPIWICSS